MSMSHTLGAFLVLSFLPRDFSISLQILISLSGVRLVSTLNTMFKNLG